MKADVEDMKMVKDSKSLGEAIESFDKKIEEEVRKMKLNLEEEKEVISKIKRMNAMSSIFVRMAVVLDCNSTMNDYLSILNDKNLMKNESGGRVLEVFSFLEGIMLVVVKIKESLTSSKKDYMNKSIKLDEGREIIELQKDYLNKLEIPEVIKWLKERIDNSEKRLEEEGEES